MILGSIQKYVLKNVDKPMKTFIQKNTSILPSFFWEAFSSRMIIDIFKFYKDFLIMLYLLRMGNMHWNTHNRTEFDPMSITAIESFLLSILYCIYLTDD